MHELSQTRGATPAVEGSRNRDRSQLLLEINAAIVSHAEMPELLEAVSACLRREIPHDIAALVLYDPDAYELKAHTLDFSNSPQIKLQGTPIPMEGTVSGLAFTSRRTVLRHSLDPEEFDSEIQRQLISNGMRSACAAPLFLHGRVLGSLGVTSRREGAFTEEHAELLLHIGNQVALAVENARNFEQLRIAQRQLVQSRDQLRLLLQVNNSVVSELELPDLLKAISASLREIIRLDLIGLALWDAERKEYVAHTLDTRTEGIISMGDPYPIEGTVGGLAARSAGRPVYVPRPDYERFPSELSRRVFEKGFKSICSVSLIAHGRSVGIMTLASFVEDAFTPNEVEMIGQIGRQVAIAVENALAFGEIERLKNKLAHEKLYLEDEIRTAYDFEEIVGRSPVLLRVLKQVATVAPTDSTVLIRGETGTGKELIARAIHDRSGRRERTLVKINCSAIPTGLLESELFGHEKGAFTGAISQRIGRFELANGGTLFLDEVGDIPLELQPKLLRVLQEQEFERLGSTRTQHVNVRLVAATNCDLEKMVAERQFRSDLYYRLNVFPVTLPPLRERAEDIPLLARFFAERFARRMGKSIESIPAMTSAALARYHWPGNVRELENVIERAVILSPGPDLEVPLSELKLAPETSEKRPERRVDESSLEIVERDHILRVLEESKWTISGPSGAAERLGMKRTTLQARMRKLGISRRSG